MLLDVFGVHVNCQPSVLVGDHVQVTADLNEAKNLATARTESMNSVVIYDEKGRVMFPTDRVQEDVLSLKDFPSLVDPFAAWYGLTKDGKILLMRDRSVQEIYALTLEVK
jgi:hypothetical protein